MLDPRPSHLFAIATSLIPVAVLVSSGPALAATGLTQALDGQTGVFMLAGLGALACLRLRRA